MFVMEMIAPDVNLKISHCVDVLQSSPSRTEKDIDGKLLVVFLVVDRMKFIVIVRIIFCIFH